MRGVVPKIAPGEQPVSDLVLNTDVPLLQRRWMRVDRRVHIDAGSRERLRLPAGQQPGERITARIVQPRIGQAAGGTRQRDLRAPGRIVRETRVEEELRRVEEAPEPA